MENANGAGSVYKLSGKRRRPYAAVITSGWKTDKATGKRSQIRKVIGTFASSPEAQRALQNYLEHPTEKLDMTWLQLYEEWSAVAFRNLSRATQDNYRASWKRIGGGLGAMRVRDIRTGNLQEAIDLAAEGGEKKKPLSRSSLEKDKALMNLLFKYAMQNDVVHKNYAEFVRLPKSIETGRRDAFTAIEVEKVRLAAEAGVPFADCVLILCYTGFRIAEFLELTPFSFDAKEKTLTGGKKTQAGRNRVIPLNPLIAPYVEKWAAKKGETIFCRDNGKPFSVKYFSEACYRPALEAAGVRPLTPHCCRHTFATMLADAGVEAIDIQHLLGHTKYEMSARYTHAQLGTLRSAVAALGSGGVQKYAGDTGVNVENQG